MARFRRDDIQVVELDEQARRVLARRYPEMSGCSIAILVAATGDVGGQLVTAVHELVDAANNGERANRERLVHMLSPEIDIPSSSLLEEARQQAVLRARLLQDFGGLSATDLAEVRGSTAGDRTQLAQRWRRERKIFAVTYRGDTWFLGFQFGKDGSPLPVIGGVLRHIGEWDGWDIAAWFVRPNGFLDRQRPVDVLSAVPDAIVEAAHADGRRRDTRPVRSLRA